MTTNHAPAASNFPLTARRAESATFTHILSPEPSWETSTTVVATCEDKDWAAFLVHAANHHEALHDLVGEILAHFDANDPNYAKSDWSDRARRITSESATQ